MKEQRWAFVRRTIRRVQSDRLPSARAEQSATTACEHCALGGSNMQPAIHMEVGSQFNPNAELQGSESLVQQILKPRQVSFVVALVAALAFFIADTLMPRGATPAIGYALVPVVAGGSRKRWVVLGVTVVCTVLTWAGFFLEPPGAARWMSAFDRLMITGVLWLTLLLVWRRLCLIAAMA